MPPKQCEHDNIIIWPLANPYINDQFKNIHSLFSQNVDFRFNTLLHGALQMVKYAHSLTVLQNIKYALFLFLGALLKLT